MKTPEQVVAERYPQHTVRIANDGVTEVVLPWYEYNDGDRCIVETVIGHGNGSDQAYWNAVRSWPDLR